jgi:hypothetical protein
MGKAKKQDRIKLPKRIAGVKVPKEARKSVNRLLRTLPAPSAKPLLVAALGTLVTSLAKALEDPLRELIEAETARLDRKRDDAARTAH